jgi:hypothetical protein
MSNVIQFPSKSQIHKFTNFEISDDEREEYEHTLLERAGAYMDEGYSEKEADHFALDDTGCVEFWQYVNYRLPERQRLYRWGTGG